MRIVRAVLPALCIGAMMVATPVQAGPTLVVDAADGRVIHAENPTQRWYPASLTKLMTTYVALKMVEQRRASLDTLVTISPLAAAQMPSKMGFQVGAQVTLSNAIAMLMVKSANDVSVAVAEGLGGSVEGFADMMNHWSRELGMTQSFWVNPHGLPDDRQVTSARDMAILARAVIREFPQYEMYFRIPAIRLGRIVMRNHNHLIDRYPGADGMKTGFICASGFNVVASATRGGRRLIVVVFGGLTAMARSEEAAQLFERGFNAEPPSIFSGPAVTLASLRPIDAPPVNIRAQVCGNRRNVGESSAEEAIPPISADAVDSSSVQALFAIQRAGPPVVSGAQLLAVRQPPSMPPVQVHLGPARSEPLAALAAPPRPVPAPADARVGAPPQPAGVFPPPPRAAPGQIAPGMTVTPPPPVSLGAVARAAPPGAAPAGTPAASPPMPTPRPAALRTAAPAAPQRAQPAAAGTPRPAQRPPARPAQGGAPEPRAATSR